MSLFAPFAPGFSKLHPTTTFFSLSPRFVNCNAMDGKNEQFLLLAGVSPQFSSENVWKFHPKKSQPEIVRKLLSTIACDIVCVHLNMDFLLVWLGFSCAIIAFTWCCCERRLSTKRSKMTMLSCCTRWMWVRNYLLFSRYPPKFTSTWCDVCAQPQQWAN